MPSSPEPDINLTTKPNRDCARGTWTEGVQQHPKLRRVMGTAHESLLYSAPNQSETRGKGGWGKRSSDLTESSLTLDLSPKMTTEEMLVYDCL